MVVANVESKKAPAASEQLVAGIAELLGRHCRVAGAERAIAAAGSDGASAVTAFSARSALTATGSSCSNSAGTPRARAAGHDKYSYSTGGGDSAPRAATRTDSASASAGTGARSAATRSERAVALSDFRPGAQQHLRARRNNTEHAQP